MTEPKPEWQIDAEISEKQGGEMLRLYLVTKRRALITELRELNDFLGLPRIVIKAGESPPH